MTCVILADIIPSLRPDLFFRFLVYILRGRIFRLGRLCSIKLLGIRSFYNDEILCGYELKWAEPLLLLFYAHEN